MPTDGMREDTLETPLKPSAGDFRGLEPEGAAPGPAQAAFGAAR